MGEESRKCSLLLLRVEVLYLCYRSVCIALHSRRTTNDGVRGDFETVSLASESTESCAEFEMVVVLCHFVLFCQRSTRCRSCEHMAVQTVQKVVKFSIEIVER